MKCTQSLFKWRHYQPEIIMLCVRWYCRFQLSYRDLEAMMHERGLSVHYSTIFRWVQRYAPEINKRLRPHLKMSGTSYRVDETYIKVSTEYKYLYRAVDKDGQTIEFMLSAKRDVAAAKRFFKKLMRADHRRLPCSISVDKNAAYPDAFAASQNEHVLAKDCLLRRVKYLNNVIEQNHRFIKKKVRAAQCFRSFYTAERTIEGVEAMNMLRKGVRPLTMQEITPSGAVLGQWHKGYVTGCETRQASRSEADGQTLQRLLTTQRLTDQPCNLG